MAMPAFERVGLDPKSLSSRLNQPAVHGTYDCEAYSTAKDPGSRPQAEAEDPLKVIEIRHRN